MPLAALLFFYLSSGTGDIERGWIWEIHSRKRTCRTLQSLAGIVLERICTGWLAGLLFAIATKDCAVILLFISFLGPTLLLLPLYSYGYQQ